MDSGNSLEEERFTMKKAIAAAIVMMLAFTFTGCVSQKDYDEAVAAKEKAQSALESAQKDLDAAKGDLEATASELDSAKADLKTANKELDSVKGELVYANAELDVTKQYLKETSAELDETKQDLEDTSAELDEKAASLEELQAEYDDYKQRMEGNKLVVSPDVKEKYQELAMERYGTVVAFVGQSESRIQPRILKDEEGQVVFCSTNYLKA